MKKEPKIKKIKLKNIRPNPHKSKDYRIEPERVKYLMESIERNSFWGFPGRMKGDKFELAHGHHRLEALNKLYTPDKEISPCYAQDLSDEEMLNWMIDENNAAFDYMPSMLDEVVRNARDFFLKNPDERRKYLYSEASEYQKKIPKINAQMIVNKIGRNWPPAKVQESLERIRAIEAKVLNPEAVYQLPSYFGTIKFLRAVKSLRADFDVQHKAAKRIREKEIYDRRAIATLIKELIDEKYPPTEKVRLERSKRSKIDQCELILDDSSRLMNETIGNLKDFKKNLGSRKKQTLNDISPRVLHNLNVSINKFDRCVKDTYGFMGMDLKDDDTLKEEAIKVERDRIQKEFHEERVLPPREKNGTPELRFTNFSEIMKIFKRCLSLFQFPIDEDRVIYKNGKFLIEGNDGGLCYFTENRGKDYHFSIPRSYVEKLLAIKADDVSIKKSQKDEKYIIKVGSVSLTLPKHESISEIEDSIFRPSHKNVFLFDESLMDLISELEFILRRGAEFVDVGGIYFGREFVYATDRLRIMRIINMMEEYVGKVLPVSLIDFILFIILFRKERPSSISFEGGKIFLRYGDEDEIEFIVYASTPAHRLREIENIFEQYIPKNNLKEVIIDKEKNDFQEFKNFMDLSSAEKGLFEYSEVVIERDSNLMEIVKHLETLEKVRGRISLKKATENITFKVNEKLFYDGLERFDRFFVSDKCIFFPGDDKEYLVMLCH